MHSYSRQSSNTALFYDFRVVVWCYEVAPTYLFRHTQPTTSPVADKGSWWVFSCFCSMFSARIRVSFWQAHFNPQVHLLEGMLVLKHFSGNFAKNFRENVRVLAENFSKIIGNLKEFFFNFKRYRGKIMERQIKVIRKWLKKTGNLCAPLRNLMTVTEPDSRVLNRSVRLLGYV